MDRCSLCPGVNNCLDVDGQGDILFIGEAPGFNENRRKRVFIGQTGDEVNRHYLPLAGLRRETVSVTNAIRCFPTTAGGKLDPNRRADIALLESCAAHHLYPRLDRGAYRLLVPLGSFACRAVCPDVDLELQHGMPVETAWGIPAFPMYHPSLGMHEPKKMLMIRTDWQRLRQYLKGTLRLPTDDYLDPDYAEVTSAEEIRDTLDRSRPIACDTESTRKHLPFCLTYSQDGGTGRLIRADNQPALDAFSDSLQRWAAPVLFHNYLYDSPIVRSMAVQLPERHVVDTMARVFHLGNLPQGLKALAFRLLGMRMQDFEDLVSPYSVPKVLHYYAVAATMDWPKPEAQLVQDSKTGLWKVYAEQSMKTKLKRFFTDYSKNSDKDVFSMWEKNWLPYQSMIEEQCGEYPGMCITHVPFDKVLHYAARDADALIRLWPVIEAMRRQVRKAPQERWAA